MAQDPAHKMPHHLVHSPPPRPTPPERRELDGSAVAKLSRPQNDHSSLSTSASPAQPASYSPSIHSRYLREQLDLTNSATPQTPRNRPLSMSERSRMKLCYSIRPPLLRRPRHRGCRALGAFGCVALLWVHLRLVVSTLCCGVPVASSACVCGCVHGASVGTKVKAEGTTLTDKKPEVNKSQRSLPPFPLLRAEVTSSSEIWG